MLVKKKINSTKLKLKILLGHSKNVWLRRCEPPVFWVSGVLTATFVISSPQLQHGSCDRLLSGCAASFSKNLFISWRTAAGAGLGVFCCRINLRWAARMKVFTKYHAATKVGLLYCWDICSGVHKGGSKGHSPTPFSFRPLPCILSFNRPPFPCK